MRRPRKQPSVSLRQIVRRLSRILGPQQWWPAGSPFEMMAGAILTQATRWENVEQAIERLRHAHALTPRRLAGLPRRRLERLVRPIGLFRQKAVRLQQFSRWYVARYHGRPERMFRRPWRCLRSELLAVPGIGPETADAILLYAGRQPVMVVDAYTHRIFRRHRLIRGDATYDDLQRRVMDAVPARARLYNELHAWFVSVGKQFCHRRDPECGRCPLGDLPHTREVIVHGRW